MIERWIIVGGCPRSGTTLVGNALGAASVAIVTPEAQFVRDTFSALRTGKLQKNRQSIIDFIAGHWRYRIWNEPLPSDWPDCSDCATAAAVASRVVNHIISEYARKREKPGARIWIDHTPENLGAVSDLLEADFTLSGVHLIRDGRGVAASMKKVDWGPKDAASLAQWWLARIAEGFAAERLLGPRATNIRYDDIVADPEPAFRHLCADLGLDYTPDMLTSQALEVIDYTRAQHQAVGLRPDPVRASAWKTSLDRREQEIFEAVAGRALALLGYERLYPEARSQTFPERLYAWAAHNPIRRRTIKRARQQRRTHLAGDV